jgi:RND family efflux transporter MFP subunit
MSAAEGAVSPSIEVSGTVTTPPDGSADVGATVSGRIVAPPGGLASPGTRVRAGQVLATITAAAAAASPEAGATAGLAVAEADARLASAESALARAERLLAERAIAQREVDAARREVEVARAAGVAARRSRAVLAGGGQGTTLRLASPIDGVIAEVSARPGQAAEPGTTLFRIVDPSVLWISARVPEADAARIRADVDARYQVVGSETWSVLDVTAPDATAEVVDVGRVVDPVSRTVMITWALRTPDPILRIGGAVQVAVAVGARWRGVVVPRAALVDDDGRDVVYVQAEGEAFEERLVRIGPRAGDVVGVEEGLRSGERVVTTGANLVRLASRATTATGHGHVH